MQIQTLEMTKNKFQAAGVPLFLEAQMSKIMASQAVNKEITHEISLFDVKELYDLAYTKPSDSEAFKTIMAEAVKMDMEYRRQLAEKSPYKGATVNYSESKPAEVADVA